MESYIRFDWAMRHLLRDKANHEVLEGFMESLPEFDTYKVGQALKK